MTEKKGRGGKARDGGEKGAADRICGRKSAVPSRERRQLRKRPPWRHMRPKKEGRLFDGSGQDGEGGGSFAKTERGGKGRGRRF